MNERVRGRSWYENYTQSMQPLRDSVGLNMQTRRSRTRLRIRAPRIQGHQKPKRGRNARGPTAAGSDALIAQPDRSP